VRASPPVSDWWEENNDQMNRAITRLWWASALLFCFCLPSASAQVTVNLTSAGNYVYDNVYISPYYGTVTQGTDPSSNTLICDDFADDSNVGSSWTANVTSFSNLASSLGNTVWGSYLQSQKVGSSTIMQLYDEAAWLTEKLLVQTAGSNNQAWYSAAVWAVFDPNGVLNWLKSYGNDAACNAIFGANCASVNVKSLTAGFVYNAQQNYASGNYSNLLILSPLIGGTVCSPKISGSGNCPAQEFFMLAAEGGAAMAYLLLAALVCFGAIYLRSAQANSSRHPA
jgi:hypothetical protein